MSKIWSWNCRGGKHTQHTLTRQTNKMYMNKLTELNGSIEEHWRSFFVFQYTEKSVFVVLVNIFVLMQRSITIYCLQANRLTQDETVLYEEGKANDLNQYSENHRYNLFFCFLFQTSCLHYPQCNLANEWHQWSQFIRWHSFHWSYWALFHICSSPH